MNKKYTYYGIFTPENTTKRCKSNFISFLIKQIDVMRQESEKRRNEINIVLSNRRKRKERGHTRERKRKSD